MSNEVRYHYAFFNRAHSPSLSNPSCQPRSNPGTLAPPVISHPQIAVFHEMGYDAAFKLHGCTHNPNPLSWLPPVDFGAVLTSPPHSPALFHKQIALLKQSGYRAAFNHRAGHTHNLTLLRRLPPGLPTFPKPQVALLELGCDAAFICHRNMISTSTPFPSWPLSSFGV